MTSIIHPVSLDRNLIPQKPIKGAYLIGQDLVLAEVALFYGLITEMAIMGEL